MGIPINRVMRTTLSITVFFVIVAGLSTYVFPEQTSTYWAWTINPPISAAFLGGGYLAAVVLELLSIRTRLWERAELSVPGVLAFSFLTLIATLLHLDRFHFGADPLPAAWAWSWFLVYLLVPFILSAVWIRQLRTPGTPFPRLRPWPVALRIVVTVIGVGYLVLGLTMFLVPTLVIPVWGWTLTPLTSRAIGAWWVGIAVLILHGVIQNDLWRSLPLAVSGAVFCVLQIANLVRCAGSLDLLHPANLALLGSLSALLAISIVLLGLSQYAVRAHVQLDQ